MAEPKAGARQQQQTNQTHLSPQERRAQQEQWQALCQQRRKMQKRRQAEDRVWR